MFLIVMFKFLGDYITIEDLIFDKNCYDERIFEGLLLNRTN